jgi:hypothetical protein
MHFTAKQDLPFRKEFEGGHCAFTGDDVRLIERSLKQLLAFASVPRPDVLPTEQLCPAIAPMSSMHAPALACSAKSRPEEQTAQFALAHAAAMVSFAIGVQAVAVSDGGCASILAVADEALTTSQTQCAHAQYVA